MGKGITIYDIAQALNISASTVSRALSNNASINNKTKRKVQTKAIEMGYRQNVYASNLRREKENVLMLVKPNLSNPSTCDALAAIERVAETYGYRLIISG